MNTTQVFSEANTDRAKVERVEQFPRCCWQPIDQWLHDTDRRRDPHGFYTGHGYRQNWRQTQPKIEDYG